MNMNDVFLSRMQELLGEEFEEFKESLNQPIQKSIYVNENKIALGKFKEIVDFSVEQIPYERCGFYVDNLKLGRHALHHAGAFYLQEPSAMFTVNAYEFTGNEKVLDMCSAPGGKTIQIANRIPNGVLVSNEIVKSRSEILFSNVERMGLKNVIISNDTPENIAKAYGDCFDVCLVDAPCSGEGMFRRGEDVLKEWNHGLNEKCDKRQIEILVEADKCLKMGGVLIYSTCTYSRIENEDVIRDFLKLRDYELINIKAKLPRGVGMNEAVRLYPHKVRGEGQFVAILKKISGEINSSESVLKLTKSKITNDFLKRNLKKKSILNTEECVMEYKKYSYYLANKEMVKKRVNYVSLGVRLGEIKGTRFEPYHNLFTAFGRDFEFIINKEFGDSDLQKYLRGETLNVDLVDCYGVVNVENCSVGGFKMSAGKFKNLYPKGLRNF